MSLKSCPKSHNLNIAKIREIETRLHGYTEHKANKQIVLQYTFVYVIYVEINVYDSARQI